MCGYFTYICFESYKIYLYYWKCYLSYCLTFYLILLKEMKIVLYFQEIIFLILEIFNYLLLITQFWLTFPVHSWHFVLSSHFIVLQMCISLVGNTEFFIGKSSLSMICSIFSMLVRCSFGKWWLIPGNNICHWKKVGL